MREKLFRSHEAARAAFARESVSLHQAEKQIDDQVKEEGREMLRAGMIEISKFCLDISRKRKHESETSGADDLLIPYSDTKESRAA
eukprot:CAMPEP_0203822058 /NCGR_PEP_ID=MMETSP0115-20131106/45101_1 /ASSEMBLY_ACC=CAM_ASM_000227 /TAXON_ID=33651 /ORGANISM="Bicosoecid sp, Strain ms1" /LENGTH=85 /DNA_ID=CAMNT_0050731089 /DNA_START=1 /DNA_END=255 /DNA_ORIENTATION=+